MIFFSLFAWTLLIAGTSHEQFKHVFDGITKHYMEGKFEELIDKFFTNNGTLHYGGNILTGPSMIYMWEYSFLKRKGLVVSIVNEAMAIKKEYSALVEFQFYDDAALKILNRLPVLMNTTLEQFGDDWKITNATIVFRYAHMYEKRNY